MNRAKEYLCMVFVAGAFWACVFLIFLMGGC